MAAKKNRFCLGRRRYSGGVCHPAGLLVAVRRRESSRPSAEALSRSGQWCRGRHGTGRGLSASGVSSAHHGEEQIHLLPAPNAVPPIRNGRASAPAAANGTPWSRPWPRKPPVTASNLWPLPPSCRACTTSRPGRRSASPPASASSTGPWAAAWWLAAWCSSAATRASARARCSCNPCPACRRPTRCST